MGGNQARRPSESLEGEELAFGDGYVPRVAGGAV